VLPGAYACAPPFLNATGLSEQEVFKDEFAFATDKRLTANTAGHVLKDGLRASFDYDDSLPRTPAFRVYRVDGASRFLDLLARKTSAGHRHTLGLERSRALFIGSSAIWAIFGFYNHVCGSRNSSCRAVASQLAGERF
jgi:hypothetical protein